MNSFPGLQTISCIYESNNTKIFRCRKKADNLPVIVKALNQEFPSKERLDSLRHEYEIAKLLNFDGIIKMYALQQVNKGLIIVMEDLDAVSLQQMIAQKQLTLEYALHIAMTICHILGKIHEKSIVHKDVNPGNILVNRDANIIKIIDYAFASKVQKQNKKKDSEKIQGTLAYIAPEQTGRMDRFVDYRSDYYSLGITLYEMITGRLPFVTKDPLRLIHCHIAKSPLTPHNLNLDIPKSVSNIVMKLIAKSPEDRYQNINGVKADLEKCLNHLKKTGNIPDFRIGQQDIPRHFQLPNKLYARDQECSQLISIFKRIFFNRSESQPDNKSDLSEIVIIKGEIGMGKTALVEHFKEVIHQSCSNNQIIFISGKNDRFSINTPYSALVAAFSELVRHLLKMDESLLVQWRHKLKSALGENGQLIINVIPEIEWIIGEQPVVNNLSPKEQKNRFEYIFYKFIMTFTECDNPLIIFIDDLQWIDQASLKLIQLILTSTGRILFIGAYRPGILPDNHMLFQTINNIEFQNIPVTNIALHPLSHTHIMQLICDTFHCYQKYAKRLSEIVLDKTQGNPFFINEFITAIYEKNLIQLTSEGWKWDADKIKQTETTDNIAQLMSEKIKRLSKATRHFIQVSACIGSDFSKGFVSHIFSDENIDIDVCISEAIDEGIIVESQKPLTEFDSCALTAYRFVYDRVRKAAYSLMSENDRMRFHRKIGQYLMDISSDNQRKARIFDIVNHLNISIEICTASEEKIQLARLNREAGLRAKSSTAYDAAFIYFIIGISQLNENNWKDNYALTSTLYLEAAETAFLKGNFDEMLRLSEEVLKHATQLMDQVKVYEIRLQAYKMQDNKLEAIAIGQKVLAMLGVSIPKRTNKISAIIAILRIYLGISGKRIDGLIDLPEMTDPKQLVVTRILTYVGTAFYISAPEILPIIVSEQIRLFTKYGNTPASSATYAAYGMILCGMLNDLDNGYKYGRLAMSLRNKFKTKEYLPKTLFRVASFILHWKEPLKNTLPLLEEACMQGVETGDVEFSMYARYVYGVYSFFAGIDLNKINNKIQLFIDKTPQLKHLTAKNYKNLLLQLLINLSTSNKTPWVFSGKYYQEETGLSSHIENQDRTLTAMFLYSKGYINYLFYQYEDARINMENAETYLRSVIATFLIPCYYFYDALIGLAIYNNATSFVQRKYLKRALSHQKKIKEWSKHSPMNHLHRYHLVQAEIDRVQNNVSEAMIQYDKAIHLARENQFLNDEALANELAAQFYIQNQKQKHAVPYLLDCFNAYQRLGMKAKTDHLLGEYPYIKDYFQMIAQSAPRQIWTSDSQSIQNISQEIDLLSIMKASTSISEEIVFSRLLEKLMTIVVENAGATRGCLFLTHNDQMFIEAELADIEQENVLVESVSAELRNDLPAQIINYVRRTYKDTRLNDAANEGDFTNDPYIRNQKIQSLMCMPILHHGKLTGLLYLENNRMTGAFTDNHVQILKLLASQAAISIENAKFYNELEDRVQERTRKLSLAIDALKDRANELMILNKMSDSLNECRQESDTHGVIQDVCMSFFPDDSGFIAIEKESSPLPEIIVRWNIDQESLMTNLFDCQCFETSQKKRISSQEITNICCPFKTKQSTNALCIPLLAQNKTIGIFHLQFKGDTDTQEENELQQLFQSREDLAVRMVEQYALSVANLRLQEKLRMESIMDPLTKLFNRRYLEKSLERESNRCKRRNKNLGVIMLDIDHFKSFNDQYGHKLGDDVLRELGAFLKQVVRKEDIACRYGGEEFMLIMPETSLETTTERAKEICKRIQKNLKVEYKDVILKITASLGVAALNEHGFEIASMIASADDALYQAKKSGRNQVCVADEI
jgi:diguanylate cyclase (GGDEF)-like protein